MRALGKHHCAFCRTVARSVPMGRKESVAAMTRRRLTSALRPPEKLAATNCFGVKKWTISLFLGGGPIGRSALAGLNIVIWSM